MLPEKWSIKITKENMSVVGAYYDKKTNSRTYSSGMEGSYLKSHNIRGESIIELTQTHIQSFVILGKKTDVDYPEITTEEFIKYVLKQELKEAIYEIY